MSAAVSLAERGPRRQSPPLGSRRSSAAFAGMLTLKGRRLAPNGRAVRGTRGRHGRPAPWLCRRGSRMGRPGANRRRNRGQITNPWVRHAEHAPSFALPGVSTRGPHGGDRRGRVAPSAAVSHEKQKGQNHERTPGTAQPEGRHLLLCSASRPEPGGSRRHDHQHARGCGSAIRRRPIVAIKGGATRGLAVPAGYEFLGLPYATPPTGNLRWRRPQPPTTASH
jgi:Carboxylesterase family